MPQPWGGAGFLRTRYRSDTRWREELNYCAAHGLPHSVFLQWDPVDQEKALLVAREEAHRCGRCGTYDWQWQDEDGAMLDPGIEAGLHRCFGCEDFDRLLHDIGERPGEKYGLRVRWYPVQLTEKE